MENEQNKTEEMTLDNASTVGSFLKYTRLKQKKSIEDISEALYIRKIYIRAIEEDNFQELPPVPYGVGFVRSYADYLGLNVERIVQFYKQQAMPQKEKTTNIVKKHTSITIPSKRHIAVGLLAVLFLYLLWVLIQSLAHRGSENFEAIEDNEDVVVEEVLQDMEEN